MQPNTRVVDVTPVLACIPGAVVADTEEALGNRVCTLYALGPYTPRYAISLPLLRDNLVKCAESVSGLFVTQRMPAFRPCPVLCLKNLFDELGDRAERCRVCFDIDTEGDGVDCAPDHLLNIFCAFLRERVTGCEDWDAEEAWIWSGSFPDKRASYHIYFPRMVWARSATNVYKNQDVTALNNKLAPYGLKLDTSITTSGIKVLGADKWLPKTRVWRGDVQRLHYIRNGPPVDMVTWAEAFQHCFAIATPGDIGHDREVNWRQIPRPGGGEAIQKRPRVVEEVVFAAPGTPDARLHEAVPEWRHVPAKHIHKDNGVVFVVPQSTFCPLKREPSSDCGAHQHAMPGKCYVVRDVLGEQRVMCHVCSGKELLIPVPVVEANDQLDATILRHFAGWARFTPGRVIRLPTASSAHADFSHNEFIQHFTRLGETVKVGKQNLPWPKYWLQMLRAPSYELGYTFDPGCAPNPGYFNTYRGFAPEVARAHAARSADFANMTMDQLANECQHWFTVVKRNVCRDDATLFNYFHSWMADCVQRPESRTGIALVVIGPPGCGKGMSMKPMLYIYGDHAMQTNDLSTKWTAVYEDKVFVFADEAIAPKDKVAQQRLLSLITEEQLVTEGKRQALRSKRLFCRVGATSNRVKALPLQAGERRYAIFGADFVAHPENTNEALALFAKAGKEIETPHTLAALLEYWLRWPLQNVELRHFPTTEAAFRAQYAAFSDYERFVYHWLCSGHLTMREILLQPESKDHMHAHAFFEESARLHGNHTVRELATCGYQVWRCEHCAVPKFVFATGFSQMYPDVRNPEVPLWKFINDLAKSVDPPLLEVKRIRVPHTDYLPRVVSLRSQSEWQNAFIKYRGHLDQRVFAEWAIHT